MENNVENAGLVLEVPVDKLRAMMQARADAHNKRVKFCTERVKRLNAFIKENAESGTADDEAMPRSGKVMNSSIIEDTQRKLREAEEQLQAHKAAEGWLRFGVENISLQNTTMTFMGTGLAFLWYLNDVENQHAMPPFYYGYGRGVQ